MDLMGCMVWVVSQVTVLMGCMDFPVMQEWEHSQDMDLEVWVDSQDMEDMEAWEVILATVVMEDSLGLEDTMDIQE